jgi:GTP-binding protein
LVALNKVDVPEAAELAEFVTEELTGRGYRVFPISAVSHAGTRGLTFELAKLVQQYRAEQEAIAPARIVLTPKAVDESGFTVEADPAEDGAFIVRGAKPERWVKQTQFDNDEAVGFLADRLARLGVEDELAKLGAMPGATVVIGDFVFDFQPTAGMADHDYAPTRRGTDDRLENVTRPNADERLAAKKSRRSHTSDEKLFAAAQESDEA